MLLKPVTPSLYSAWYFWKEGNTSLEDFLKTLRKEKVPPTKIMQEGIDFENEIQLLTQTVLPEKPETPAEKIAKIVQNGEWQVSVSASIENYLVYGRCDVVTPNVIYDIKKTARYEAGKYYYSIQHLIYSYCLNIDKTVYLIGCGKNFYQEEYYFQSLSGKNLLINRLNEMFALIYSDTTLKNTYEEYWLEGIEK